ncbi:MAG: hypothetical protein H0V05_21560 [Euzebyaceae bacterium]|nr:hypothetical protein [Euzebyaceae bacterium]
MHTNATTARQAPSRTQRLALIVLAVAAVLALLPTPPANAAYARPAGPLVPPTGVLFGEYLSPTDDGYTFTRTSQQARITDQERRIGRQLDLSMYFYGWKSTFPSWREQWHLDNGRTPVISWARGDTVRINTGEFDAMIRARADGVKALGQPVFIRWFQEMDGNWTAKEAHTPADFIAAWRRIHRIFEQRGATNAVWAWCPNAHNFATGESQRWYPGDDQVDWICADGYNWAPGRARDDWRTTFEIFEAFHAFGVSRNKPMMVGETGVQERRTGEKAEWFRQVAPMLRDQLPGIAAWIYFDSNKLYDWRSRSTSASATAFRELANDPYMNTRR